MNTEQTLFFIFALWVTLCGFGLAMDAAGAFIRARTAYAEARARRARLQAPPPPGRDAGHFPEQAKDWER